MMAKARIDSVVIDTCVARSAGDPSKSGHALACAAILYDINNSVLDARFDKGLYKEWIDHASKYSRKWLVEMRSRRRVKVEASTNVALVKKINGSKASKKEKDAMIKDVFLLEIAIKNGSPIFSDDHVCFSLFLTYLGSYKPAMSCAWLPVISTCSCRENLLKGKFPYHCQLSNRQAQGAAP